MELNGIANLHILIDGLAELYCIDTVRLEKIKEELDFLERYMVQVSKDAQNPVEIRSNGFTKTAVKLTPWHEIKANKHLYPKNNGQI